MTKNIDLCSFSDEETKELMDFMNANGIMNFAEAAEKLQMKKKEEYYLSMHHNAIYYDEKQHKYRTLINDGTGKKIQVKRNTEESVRQAVIEHYKTVDDERTLTVRKAMMEFIEYRYRGEEKQATKERNIADISRFFGDIENRNLASFTVSGWCVYLEDFVKDHHPKRRSFSNARSLLRMTLQHHRKRGHIDIDINKIFEDLEIDSDDFGDTYKEDSEEVLSEEESKTLVNYLWKKHEDPVCLLLLLQYFTGIRVGEALALSHEDVYEDHIYVHKTIMGTHKDSSGNIIRNAVKKTTKTPKGKRRIPLSDGSRAILEALKDMNTDNEFIFVNKKGEIYSRNAVGCKLTRICKKLDIPHKSPHKLRKTFCSILKESGMDDAAITTLMGHSEIATTNRFYVRDRSTVDQLSDKVGKISGLNAVELLETSSND